MKKCIKCGHDMSDDAKFCSKCGSKQELVSLEKIDDSAKKSVEPEKSENFQKINEVSIDKNVVENVPEESQKVEFKEKSSDSNPNTDTPITSSTLRNVAFAALAITANSVFMPMFKIVGLMDISMMDYSKTLAIVVLAVCGLSLRALLNKQYEFLTVAAQGMLLFFLAVYIQYDQALSDLRRNFWGAMAGKAVTVEWGVYAFLIGTLVIGVVGILYGIISQSKAISFDQMCQQWREYTLKEVEIYGIKLQGFVWVIGLALVLLFLTSQANPVNNLQENFLRNYR